MANGRRDFTSYSSEESLKYSSRYLCFTKGLLYDVVLRETQLTFKFISPPREHPVALVSVSPHGDHSFYTYSFRYPSVDIPTPGILMSKKCKGLMVNMI